MITKIEVRVIDKKLVSTDTLSWKIEEKYMSDKKIRKAAKK
jgi:hypothetical protein